MGEHYTGPGARWATPARGARADGLHRVQVVGQRHPAVRGVWDRPRVCQLFQHDAASASVHDTREFLARPQRIKSDRSIIRELEQNRFDTIRPLSEPPRLARRPRTSPADLRAKRNSPGSHARGPPAAWAAPTAAPSTQEPLARRKTGRIGSPSRHPHPHDGDEMERAKICSSGRRAVGKAPHRTACSPTLSGAHECTYCPIERVDVGDIDTGDPVLGGCYRCPHRAVARMSRCRSTMAACSVPHRTIACSQ